MSKSLYTKGPLLGALIGTMILGMACAGGASEASLVGFPGPGGPTSAPDVTNAPKVKCTVNTFQQPDIFANDGLTVTADPSLEPASLGRAVLVKTFDQDSTESSTSSNRALTDSKGGAVVMLPKNFLAVIEVDDVAGYLIGKQIVVAQDNNCAVNVRFPDQYITAWLEERIKTSTLATKLLQTPAAAATALKAIYEASGASAACKDMRNDWKTDLITLAANGDADALECFKTPSVKQQLLTFCTSLDLSCPL